MRLAQAARNLSITTDDIITFLAKRDITIEKDSNTKLDEASINLLFEYFDTDIPKKKNEEPELATTDDFEEKEAESQENHEVQSVSELEKEEENTPIETEETKENLLDSKETIEVETTDLIANTEDVVDKGVDIEEHENKVEESDTTNKTIDSEPKNKKYKTVADLLEAEEEESEEDIVIKAPKVSLQGLNVLGKIDLPEPKVKPEQELKESEKKKGKEVSKNRAPRKASSRNTRKELTPQQIREREKKKELRKREEAERKAKIKREQFYKEQILKPKQEQQKKKKPKKKKEAEIVHTQLAPKPMPKSLMGKFWRWLNT